VPTILTVPVAINRARPFNEERQSIKMSIREEIGTSPIIDQRPGVASFVAVYGKVNKGGMVGARGRRGPAEKPVGEMFD